MRLVLVCQVCGIELNVAGGWHPARAADAAGWFIQRSPGGVPVCCCSMRHLLVRLRAIRDQQGSVR
jgi:hypothetical protein